MSASSLPALRRLDEAYFNTLADGMLAWLECWEKARKRMG